MKHENFTLKFIVKESFFESAERHPDYYDDSYELGGITHHEIAIPHGLIEAFNEATVGIEKV